MTFEGLIAAYGYAAIAVGTFLEGETVLALGGFAAHRGYLYLPWVVLSGFLGTLFGDQLYFHIGRLKGYDFIKKRPKWEAKADKVFPLLHKHQTLLVLGFRFVYGLRTVTPFLLGAGGLPVYRFLILNIIGGFSWALAIGTLGYLFGHTLETALGNIKRYELWLALFLAAAGGVLWLLRLLRSKKSRRRTGLVDAAKGDNKKAENPIKRPSAFL